MRLQAFLDEVPYLSDLQRTFIRPISEARWEKLLLPAYELAPGKETGFGRLPIVPEKIESHNRPSVVLHGQSGRFFTRLAAPSGRIWGDS